jgi:ABC-type branched-subunit amino acid transport system ATPase component
MQDVYMIGTPENVLSAIPSTSASAAGLADTKAYIAAMRAAGLGSATDIDEGGEGWDTGRELAAAIETAKSVTPSAVKTALEHQALVTGGIQVSRVLGSRIVGIDSAKFRRRIFIMTAVLAALFGIVESPITGYTYMSGPTLSLIGVVAAGFASFRRPGRAVAAGLVIDATGWSAMRRSRSGVARTWQTVRLAHGRTALDNVAAACLRDPGQWMIGTFWRPEAAPARERAWAAMESLGIGHLAAQLVDGLTLEAQRLTELARALASEPTVLLADEPASGLSAAQRSVLAEALTTISADRAVVVVEHDLDMLTFISGHMWAMVEGRLAYSGDVENFRSTPLYAGLRGIVQE